MANPSNDAIPGRFEVKPTASDHFSWLRTRLSVERTLMSWVRTAISLIGFGFAIVQFFDRLKDLPGVAPARFPEAPRYLGLALILCGVVALVISLWDTAGRSATCGAEILRSSQERQKRGSKHLFWPLRSLSLSSAHSPSFPSCFVSYSGRTRGKDPAHSKLTITEGD